MEKFLGIVLIIIFSFIILGWLMRLILPFLLGWLVKRLMKNTMNRTFHFGNFNQYQDNQYQDNQHQNDEQSDFIQQNQQKPKQSPRRDKGEYVEFEEIKD